mgnify:CR=1 FL=1
MRALGIVLLLLTGPLVAAPLTQESPRVNAMTWLDLTRIGDRIVAVGERGNVLYSDDEGETWRLGETPGKAMLTAVCFADRSHGWAVGHDAVVWATDDGGETWQQQYSDPLNGDEGEEEEDTGGQADDGGGQMSMQDLYSDDASGSDEGMYSGGGMAPDTSGAPFLDVWCDTDEHVMAVGGYGYMLETEDGGAQWNKRMRDLDNPDGWHLYSIRAIPRGDGTLLIAGEQGTLFRSRDHGQSWERLEAPYEGSYFGITAAQRDTVLIHGMQGNVWLTRDLGENWKRIKTGVSRGINDGARLGDGSIVLVGNSGIALTSHDNGSSLSLRYTAERETLSAVLPLRDGGVLVAGTDGLQKIRELH